MKPRNYAVIAGVVLAAEAAFAVAHRLTRGEYGGFAPSFAVGWDAMLATIFIVGAVGAVAHRTFPAMFMVVLGALASLTHGCLFSVASPGTYAGVPFLLGAPVIIYALVKSLPSWTSIPAVDNTAVRRIGLEPRSA